MFKFVHFSVLVLVLFFVFSFTANAGKYTDGVLLRAEGDIKVYLINNNIRSWVSSIEVFNFNNFKWQNVKIVPKKEITAIEEGKPIVLETVSPHPSPEATEGTATPSLVPIASISPTPPVPAKVNLQFPAPDYIRADWLISRATSDYGHIGQRITIKYSDTEADKIENFRLYEKKPGDAYFNKIADFEKVRSTGCEDADIDGEWMMFETGQCGYWFIQRTIPPGGRGLVAYLPPAKYSEGEYRFYVAGVDKDGSETPPSSEAKLVFLSTIDIKSPAEQQKVQVYPVFKWSIATGWPVYSVPDYFISISDNEAGQNPLWGKQIKIPEGKSEESFIYDGLSLDPAKTYKVYIYGHYRKSEQDPDYISIPSAVPKFKIGLTNPATSFRWLLKAFFIGIFDFLR